MHLRGKTKSCGFGVLMNYHCNLFYLNTHVSIIFSILLRISKGSHRTMCFRESCNSNFLPGIAETTGVRWRGQGQGEKIYKLIVWICMNYLGSYMGVRLCCCSAPPCESLKPWIFHVLLTSCHPLCSLQALEAFTDKLQRQLAEAEKKITG